MMTRDVGLPLARALRGLLARRLRRLHRATCWACASSAHRFGGSHAQRDVVHLTLLEAALRAGRTRLAQALAAERTALKPDSPFNRLLPRARA